jgi:hypothetical protein
MLHDTAAGFQQTGRATPSLQRTYVYDGRLYDVTLTGASLPEITIRGRTHPRPLQADFTVRNRSTGEISAFQIVYGSTGGYADTPLRVIYRPRWWLELELTLKR